MRRIVHRFKFKKEKAGQSIVLLAIGFIALIAFVGLVTDLSLLFVRYSALRRAVDSSAIAAAGQIREGRDYGDVAIAARQYIELHGLEPNRVFVETCETDIAAWRAGTGEWEGSPHPPASYTVENDMPETELCQWDNPRKLVRVTAQIQSPTTFLKLVGWNDITLEATSVSETAVLDVALILDGSATMSQNTDLSTYVNAHAGRQDWIRADCMRTSPDTGENPDPDRLKWAGCCANPGAGFIRQDTSTGAWNIWTDVNGNGTYDGSGEDGIRPLGGNPTALPDPNFTDLICEPFKQVKDAARNFIRRLDFIRGDRVALVTFAREGEILVPWYASSNDEIMITSESGAIDTLNMQMAPDYNGKPSPYGTNNNYFDRYNRCRESYEAQWDYDPSTGLVNGFVERSDLPLPAGTAVNPLLLRFWSYETIAPCPDTNTGSGIFWANNALTNVETIRKDAVWVIILLSDGGANVTDSPNVGAPLQLPTYGAAGFCPWRTFCNGVVNGVLPVYGECPVGNTDTLPAYCNDNTPITRHFCLQWTNDPLTNGMPQVGNPECSQTGNYDADDFARDWADYAGLQEVRPGVEGNFVAMFTIGFSNQVVNSPVAGPLLHYIADAGDNGFIDDDIQQDLRDDGFINSSITPGDRGPCQGITNYRTWCGQYYFADNLQSLDAVFEAIASRLFTRISR